MDAGVAMKKPELRPGRVKCLKCGNMFDSRDVCTNRICPGCTRTNQREYVPRIAGSRVWGDGGSASIDHDGN
jgi:hypothetical protein